LRAAKKGLAKFMSKKSEKSNKSKSKKQDWGLMARLLKDVQFYFVSHTFISSSS
jgi:hypothetical protein